MPVCRVYLFTYNRHELLKRAVQSLINQTLTDWVCELHNDLPGDQFPSEYINSLKDKRFIIRNHPVNYGATTSFNFAFSGCIEKYASILEDDNWWEPDFLKDMIAIMEADEEIDVSWSNMFIWRENTDRTWENTGSTIWPVNNDMLFQWPQPKQALGALHSNGAMIYKGSKAKAYQIPESSLFNAVELIRERSFKHPVFLNSKPLANFSLTINTVQSKDNVHWTGTQVMVLASYLLKASDRKREFIHLLNYYQSANPSPIPVFFLAILFYIKEWSLLLKFNLKDWVLIVRWCLANFFKINRLGAYLESQQETWVFLKDKTPVVN